MYEASKRGHLSVCKWLLEVGAGEDITNPIKFNGFTPLSIACDEGQLSVCKWLILNGAFESSNTQTKKKVEKLTFPELAGHHWDL